MSFVQKFCNACSLGKKILISQHNLRVILFNETFCEDDFCRSADPEILCSRCNAFLNDYREQRLIQKQIHKDKVQFSLTVSKTDGLISQYRVVCKMQDY